MQVLSSPTRNELVRAHNKKIWLHIGVPNTRNLWHIGKDRAVLWILLFCSSVPLHLIFNSVVFANIQANDYAVLPVTPGFLNGGQYNISGLLDLDEASLKGLNSSAIEIRGKFQKLLAQGGRTANLSTAECLDSYDNQYISRYGDVLLVQEEVIWRNNAIWAPTWRFENGTKHASYYNWTDIRTVNQTTYPLLWPKPPPNKYDAFPFISRPDEYPSSGWLCPSRSTTDCDTSSRVEIPDRDTWSPYGSPVQHCVVELVEEQCKLQFSTKIAIAVVVANAVKAACIITMLLRNKSHYLVTLGDAIACFLESPDPETRGRCLHGKALMVKEWTWMTTHGLTDPKSITVEPEIYAPQRLRWAKAASKRRWWMTYLTYAAALIFACVAIPRALAGMPTSPSALWAVGFGELHGNNLLALSTTTMGSIFVANVPQALLSYLYVGFNALYTCMLVAREWARYYAARKPLRVTSPLGKQRSTYWLQLPYRYALPLTVMSGLLHWLVSQSLFMVSVTILDNGSGERAPDRTVSTCGYSPVAIILTTAVGSVLVLGGLVLAARRYPAQMPLASSCSAAISAACHPPEEDVSASMLPVQWGVVKGKEGGSAGVEHISFTSFEVSPPLVGRMYA
ncbi:hypothetical protein B0J12DRAFT_564431 [Macrophomina phaseolina]|uniref:DUF6536 domain-containing protein n=1 Tax=Macrophomina phaseolina TaxID=35725 RepID=A0ABQ8GR45_9PEZI|nr:hypothetical protein B0J12DRAFT_564431 [Macrophomina phaseolina]